MRPRPLSDVAEAVGGRLLGDDATATSVATDSRTVTPGSLFFALRGEHADGHDFVADAMARGATGVVVHRPVPEGPAVEVADTARALLALAADERARMPDATVIAITGANGKTSAKDFTAAILGAAFRTHASPASFNNEIGLPLTLLGAPDGVEVIVAEMGARRSRMPSDREPPRQYAGPRVSQPLPEPHEHRKTAQLASTAATRQPAGAPAGRASLGLPERAAPGSRRSVARHLYAWHEHPLSRSPAARPRRQRPGTLLRDD